MKKTASEFLNDIKNITYSQEEMMIEFAKLHVTKALEAAYNNATIDDIGSPNCDGEWMPCGIVDKDSILNSYPLDNIK
jgi:hypothetical protein